MKIEKDRLLCYVNDQLVIESNDTTYKAGKFGLAKFRETEAEFKGFQVGQQLGSKQVDVRKTAASLRSRRLTGCLRWKRCKPRVYGGLWTRGRRGRCRYECGLMSWKSGLRNCGGLRPTCGMCTNRCWSRCGRLSARTKIQFDLLAGQFVDSYEVG